MITKEYIETQLSRAQMAYSVTLPIERWKELLKDMSKMLDVVDAAKESLKDADPLFKSTERLAKALEALGVKDEGIYYNFGGLG